MRREELQVFIDGLINFFSSVSKDSAKVSSPYLIDSISNHICEFTGIIGITGRYSGNILYTAPKLMLLQLLPLYGERSRSSRLLLDLVGEIANTISGNAREKFGPEFDLSPPILSRGSIKDIQTAEGLQTFCIPILWRQNASNLIIAVD